VIDRSFLDRFEPSTKADLTLAQLLDFDHFNDYRNTLDWLERQGIRTYLHLFDAIDHLKVSHWIWENTGYRLPKD
jgi:hypothetical protein